MRYKQIIPMIILLLLSFITKAQSQSNNPYKEIGKRGEIVTLTKGEYDEFFDEDSIQRIGSAFVDVNTMKVASVNLTKEEQRQLDNARESRFLSVDPLTKKFAELTPYQFASNTPIRAIDLDGLEAFFVAGAGNDNNGWNYVDRFKNTFTKAGISDFTRVDASNGKTNDILFTNTFRNEPTVGLNSRTGITYNARDNDMVQKSVKDVTTNLKKGKQLNLIGYSYGSVIQAYTAIDLVQQGHKVDNLVLIGSPISDGSTTMNILNKYQSEGKIGKIIRYDILGDHLSNPSNEMEFVYGGWQNRKDSGPHFDLARPDDPKTPKVDEGKVADAKIKDVAEKLKKEGVK